MEGFYFEYAGKHFIIDLSNTNIHATYLKEDIFDFDLRAFIVDPKTLCQYTGMTDKNGNKIWENDVVRHYNIADIPKCYNTGIIKWNKQFARFEKHVVGTDEIHILDSYCRYEVIGNIFDNPELLEEE